LLCLTTHFSTGSCMLLQQFGCETVQPTIPPW
jgi:hypothetical protein